MTKSSNSIVTFDWDARLLPGDQASHNLFNSNPLAMANRLEGHAPFAIEVNGNVYLAFKRHGSALIGGLSLKDMVAILENIPKVRSILGPMGIKAISLNSLNAVNDPVALARAINLNCNIRFEYLLDIAQYSLSRISSNHKRNIKKSTIAGGRVLLPTDIESMRSHIELVNTNLGNKGLGGITNSPEYFHYLLKNNAGLLMQVTENEQLLASTFFITNQDYAYYHSSGTSDQGKKIGAAYFIVDRIISEMKNRQMHYLNLGGCTSEQTGLQRFKMGFRPETRVLVSTSSRLMTTGKQRIRSLLSTRPSDIVSAAKVKVYIKAVSDLPPVDLKDLTFRKMSYDSLLDAVSKAPELSRSLTILCRPSPHCYALFKKQDQIIAIAFIETAEINRKSSTNRHSLPSDVGEITHVHVIGSMRGKGIGRILIALLEWEVFNLGLNRAYSRVNAQNIASQKMFLAAGFTLLGEEKVLSTEFMGGRSRIIRKVEV